MISVLGLGPDPKPKLKPQRDPIQNVCPFATTWSQTKYSKTLTYLEPAYNSNLGCTNKQLIKNKTINFFFNILLCILTGQNPFTL